jgi:AAA+ ATPase superfamily predicted ATPase
MENEVMGYQSPLYGRSTAQLEMQPFDYYESGEFFPNYSNLEKVFVYGILGGIPCYLQAFDDSRSVAENIVSQILRTGSFLKDEPQLLLKMELREPSVYNSIFEAIAGGASRLNEISGKIHEESFKCSKYISTLRAIKLIDKITPCGEKESSKKSIYRISDNYYSFWYYFVFSNKSYYEILGEEEAVKEVMEDLSNYMGSIFEQICCQYMIRLGKARKLPFIPHTIGRWWGNNPEKKSQDDIDILALEKSGDQAIFCECKFKNERFGIGEYEDLLYASRIFKQPEKRFYYLFSKSGFTKALMEKVRENECVKLVGIDDLYGIIVENDILGDGKLKTIGR